MIENNNAHLNPSALNMLYRSVNFFLFSYTSNTVILRHDPIISVLHLHFEFKAT